MLEWLAKIGKRQRTKADVLASFGQFLRARYDAAQTTDQNSNHWGQADALDADSANSASVRKKLRERSRYEVANNCYARGIVRTHANAVVGTGPRLQVLLDNESLSATVETAWSDWARHRQLADKLRTMRLSQAVDGESVAILTTGDDFANVTLDVRLVETEQLATPDLLISDSLHVDGIDLDDSTGRPVRYHILRQHPGSSGFVAVNDSEPLPASAVIHLFRADRPGQHRGIPEITPALELFAVLRRYTRATLLAAETAASFALFLKTNSTAIEPAEVDAWESIAYKHGAAVTLPDGWDVTQLRAENPSTAYGDFKRQLIAEIARCLNMPYNVAAADSSNHNYSSGRLDHQVYGREVETDQDYYERACLDRIFAKWLEEATMAGVLPVEAMAAEASHEWHWDPLEDIDPQKTANARVDALKSAMTSIPTEFARNGRDWRSEFTKQAQALGLTFEEYQSRVAGVLLPLPTSPTGGMAAASGSDVADSSPSAEFGGLSRRQWQNNVKAIRDILSGLIAGTTTATAADTMLQSLGLSAEKSQALIQDAQDNQQVDDPALTGSFGGQLLRANRRHAGDVLLSGTARINAAAGEQSRIEILAYNGGLLLVAGFALPVVVDVAGLEISSQVRPVLIDHDDTADGVLGQTEIIAVDPATGRITASGLVLGVSDRARRVTEMAAAGYQWQASIGCVVQERELVPAGRTVEVNGQAFSGPVIVARRATLREISFVPTGADDRTSAQIAANAAGDYVMPTFEEWLASLGFDLKTLSDAQRAVLTSQYQAQQAAANPPAQPAAATAQPAGTTPAAAVSPAATVAAAASQDPVHTLRAAAAAESERIAAVTRETENHIDLRANAIREGWTVERTQLEVLRANRPVAPMAFIPSQPEGGPQVIEAALAQAGRIPEADLTRHFTPQALQAAHTRFRGRIGLQQILLEAAWEGGYRGRHFDRGATGMGAILRAAFSTLSLPGILSNNANKFLLAGFMAVEDAWRQITATRSVNDFKTITSYRMTGAFQFEKVGPTGELKHGAVGEESFTNKADTYGKLFAVTRQDIINDDLGSLSDLPKRIGRGAGLKLNDVFWTEFCADHSTFFPTDGSDGNYQEGAGTALSITSLTAAEKLFFDQVDPDGNPLAIDPEIMLVPNALFVTGTQLTRDTDVRDTTASTKYTTGNPHAGKFRPVRTSYLGHASYGNSTKAWYLLANPNELAMIEVVFLNGQQQPTVESADADFDVLGIQMRGYFDFGVNKQDKRAAVKSKGEA